MIGDESETLQKTHSMNRHFTSQSGRTWLVALLMTSTPLVFALIRGMWFAPIRSARRSP